MPVGPFELDGPLKQSASWVNIMSMRYLKTNIFLQSRAVLIVDFRFIDFLKTWSNSHVKDHCDW